MCSVLESKYGLGEGCYARSFAWGRDEVLVETMAGRASGIWQKSYTASGSMSTGLFTATPKRRKSPMYDDASSAEAFGSWTA